MSRLSSAEPSIADRPRSRSRPLPPRSAPAGRPSKRIILCEDGSWLNSDSGSLKASISIPSNVTRISRAIKPVSSDGIPQIVNYHWGVGGGGGIGNKLLGIAGQGLEEIVREGYSFVANNYLPGEALFESSSADTRDRALTIYLKGDELFIFGFSRGAFSARSIAGLIGDIGILTNEGQPYLAEIYRDVKHQHDSNYVPKNPDIPFPNKPSASDPRYRRELHRLGMTRLHVPIKVVGVWDTVGSLGTPKIGWLTRLGIQSAQMKDLSFYDTSLSDSIEYAFQALALDERRFAFPPTLWEKFEGNPTVLRQVWFPGAHSNIGGGYEDQQMATISLAWMMAQCQPFLDFDLDYIHDEWESVEEYYEKTNQKPRQWSFGEIFSGVQGVYAVGGSKVRTPGRYCATDPTNGRPTSDPLMDTHEYIHPSVRSRLKLHGPGLEDRGDYDCKALRDWKLVVESEDGAKRPTVYWKARDRPGEGFVKVLPEAPLWQLELELLHYDPDTEAYVTRPSGVRQRRSQKRSRRSNTLSP